MSNQNFNTHQQIPLTKSLKEILTNNWVPKYLCLLLAITVWGVVLFSTTSRESGWESDASVAAPEDTNAKMERSVDPSGRNFSGALVP